MTLSLCKPMEFADVKPLRVMLRGFPGTVGDFCPQTEILLNVKLAGSRGPGYRGH
jgi:hypothetical protein